MTNQASIRFPKENAAFLNDSKLKRTLKKLEDRIEQMYQTFGLLNSLEGIVQIVEPHAKPVNRDETPPAVLSALQEIISLAPLKDQLDIDRDSIWEMKSRAGTLYVLTFLSPKLMMSMETLFSGIVVQYIQMFNKSRRRAPLSCDAIFAGDNEALALHLKINEIRNKHYAHKEAVEGQHHLSYYVNKRLSLMVDEGGPHHTVDFHLTSSHKLMRNLRLVLSYLQKDVEAQSESLMSGLNDEQRSVLFQHWDNSVKRGLIASTSHTVMNRYEP